MARAVKAQPSTLTVDITWSPKQKCYVATLSYLAGTGRHGIRMVALLQNEVHPSIDEVGAALLLEALRIEYRSWLF